MLRQLSSLKGCRKEGRRGSILLGGHSRGKEEADPKKQTVTGDQQQTRSDSLLSPGRDGERSEVSAWGEGHANEGDEAG